MHVISVVIFLEVTLEPHIHREVSFQDLLLLCFTKFAFLLSPHIELHLVHGLTIAAQNELGLFGYLVKDVLETKLQQFCFIGLKNVKRHFENGFPTG